MTENPGSASFARDGTPLITELLRPPNRGIGRFFGPLQVEYLPLGQHVRLLVDFKYEDPDGKIWIAPAGLVSDGASIPRALWAVVGSPLWGPHVFGAILHDARYRFGDCTKRQADMLLWDAALCGGTGDADACAIVDGVVLGGQLAWEANAVKRAACGWVKPNDDIVKNFLAGNMPKLLAWA